MKDIQRVWALWWLAALPFIVASIVTCIGTGITITASSQLTTNHFVLLLMAAVFGFFVFWKHPRLRHYNRVFAEHEENYRYEEEIERLDLSDTKMRDVDPFVCDYIVRALEPVIKHLQTADILELDHPELVNHAREKLRPVAEAMQSFVDQFTRMPIPEIPEEAQ